MKRLLVLGGGGMLGHKLWQLAGDRLETWATVRQVTPALKAAGLGHPDRTIEGIEVRQPGHIDAALEHARPDAVVNCVGIIKQLAAAKDPVESIAINALHPHLLARACAARGGARRRRRRRPGDLAVFAGVIAAARAARGTPLR